LELKITDHLDNGNECQEKLNVNLNPNMDDLRELSFKKNGDIEEIIHLAYTMNLGAKVEANIELIE
jgi:hypothetical protein